MPNTKANYSQSNRLVFHVFTHLSMVLRIHVIIRMMYPQNQRSQGHRSPNLIWALSDETSKLGKASKDTSNRKRQLIL